MNKLLYLRKQRGLRQADVANAIGCTQTTLSGWETGRIGMSTDNLIRLSEALNCSTDEILGLDEQDPVLVNDDPELTAYLEEPKNPAVDAFLLITFLE